VEEGSVLALGVRRLCQGVVFRRAEANLHFSLMAELRPDMADLLHELSALARHATTIQARVR
jgi:hypothetical protein